MNSIARGGPQRTFSFESRIAWVGEKEFFEVWTAGRMNMNCLSGISWLKPDGKSVRMEFKISRVNIELSMLNKTTLNLLHESVDVPGGGCIIRIFRCYGSEEK